ncbi:MAG TPA: hypothetical protein HPQ00_02085 [Magnetococcales bacterium]|nr:hypothetical protein [Magnetococcales bacterium]
MLQILIGREAVELLTVEFASTQKRLPDLLFLLKDDSIFHLELQILLCHIGHALWIPAFAGMTRQKIRRKWQPSFPRKRESRRDKHLNCKCDKVEQSSPESMDWRMLTYVDTSALSDPKAEHSRTFT